MEELSEIKLSEIVETYINGNISMAKEDIKQFNPLQAIQFVSEASRYGLNKNLAYTLLLITYRDN